MRCLRTRLQIMNIRPTLGALIVSGCLRFRVFASSRRKASALWEPADSYVAGRLRRVQYLVRARRR